MTIHDAMLDACRSIGIKPPRYTKPGQWVRTDTEGKNGKSDASVLIFDDGQGGIVWNWQTQEKANFSADGAKGVTAPRRDPERDRQQEQERQEVARICHEIVRACRQDAHPYLVRKGFPDELGLVIDDPRAVIPGHKLGAEIALRIPKADGPMLVIPGWIGQRIATVQFITTEGEKRNIYRGQMGGARHRIAVGRETWVCEGIATALSVRAALRLLGRSATVLSAFSASNVAMVAERSAPAIIAADNDKPVEQFGGLGTGEYYAVKSGARWVMPPARGDFNDMHQAESLRAVAMRLREVAPP